MEDNKQIEITAERVTKALRWAGTVAIILSAVVFMLQGLNSLSSFERFLSFAGMSAALAALGIYAGARWKEAKSARTLLGLAGAATPVLFSQLGAMIYATSISAEAYRIPLAITAPSATAMLAATIVTGLVMTPILYLGFGAFFRARARELAIMMIAGSTLLLIPLRDADVTALLILTQTLGLSAFVLKARKKPAGEMESLVAGALPLIPALIMLARQSFYGGSHFLTSSALLLTASVLLLLLPYMSPLIEKRAQVRGLGLGAASAAWAFLVFGLLERFHLPRDLDLMLAFYPVAITQLFLRESPRGLARASSLLIPVVSLFGAWHFAGALAFLGIGFFTAALGFTRRNQPVFESGLLTSTLGMIHYVCLSLRLIYSMPWLSLATLGIATIMAAAWLEKNRHRLSQWRKLYSTHFRGEACL